MKKHWRMSCWLLAVLVSVTALAVQAADEEADEGADQPAKSKWRMGPHFKEKVGDLLDTAERRTFKAQDGTELPYRLFKPAGFSADKKYPLVLCFHGSGGRGNDNIGNIAGNRGFCTLGQKDIREKHPAFLLAPQCPVEGQWVGVKSWSQVAYKLEEMKETPSFTAAIEILDAVMKEFPIDPERVYVTGQSMGGFAAWYAIMKYPTRFAAAVPVCGGSDLTQAKAIAHIPIWTFHGEKDRTVPTRGTQVMVAALKEAGSAVKYTEIPGAAHNGSWDKAWATPELIPWLFEQKRQADRKP